ncbi:cation diffusion facilitator family transporter [Microbispora sp. H10670]|uniref:cation diffusion facilitator family transporter n=1 Tax=Microbispora sp. H10670 TaxID=2729108 RepID=UPI0016019B97|nr:cation diffusion facilitator family transporter [Microbispora sp. H10670]
MSQEQAGPGPRHEHGHGHGHGHEHERGRSPGHGHGPGHAHEHRQDGGHEAGHGHGHGHGGGGLRGRVAHLLRPHSHEAADKVDPAMESSARGMRALWVSLAGLGATTLVQAVVVVLSGSVALLGDTLHNAADALTAVPLGIAFLLGRRPPTRRYTYGYGRAEDLAGVAIVLTIAASSAAAAYAAIVRLLEPREVTHLGAVAAAALVGFAGNELVARHRIRVGREIGSAALVADGLHARTDGLTSLAVLAGAGGAALGWTWADPAVGLLITVAILTVLRQAAREVYRRLMDAVDPALVDLAEATLRGTPGVLGTGQVRLRWIGHRLRAECEVIVDAGATVVEAHRIAVEAEHNLIHAVPRLTAAIVHPDPLPGDGVDHHAVLDGHHRDQRQDQRRDHPQDHRRTHRHENRRDHRQDRRHDHHPAGRPG